ncbi:HAD family hydrolase [Paenibacillus campi]|uniref:HAD family hydrolase n=1 Tax=Paenibacillus campi TaxID=3106031 RepID=UPI002AFFA62A|nr:HAD family hydrolase [Paenibacillus sp. SGZ-1009]
MSIKAVLFDLDDTLLWDERSIEEAFHYTCLTAANAEGIDAAELEKSVRREARALYESYETFPFTQMIGINPFEGLWAQFTAGEQPEFRKLEQIAPVYRKQAWNNGLQALGIDNEPLAAELAEQFVRERRNRPHFYEETLQILGELKGKVKLLLLTNGCPALQQEKLDGVPELAPYFDHIVISGAFGRGKPDPSIFRHALELLDVQPAQALMVGDKLTTDIKGALATGITSVWLNRNGKTNDSEIKPAHEIKHLSELHGIAAGIA